MEEEATLVGREGELYGRIRFARDDGSLIRVRLCKRERVRDLGRKPFQRLLTGSK